MAADTEIISRLLRGIPLWLVCEYLLELGGQPGPAENQVTGPEWSVQLAQVEPFQIGSLVVGQLRMDLEVHPEAAGPFLEALDKKLLRAGG
jgi:hypothetical protein